MGDIDILDAQDLVGEFIKHTFVHKFEDNLIYFKLKIYNTMLKWKSERNSDTALLIQSTKRIGNFLDISPFKELQYPCPERRNKSRFVFDGL